MSTAWKIVTLIAAVLALATLLVGAFALGARVGGAHTYRAGSPGLLHPSFLPAPIGFADHGVFGTVEEVDLAAGTIAVRNDEGTRVLVQVGSDTLLEWRGGKVDLAGVKVGQRVVAIGAPNQEGCIVARAVRVLGAGPGRPVPLWSALARGIYRIYRSIDLALSGLLGRKGS